MPIKLLKHAAFFAFIFLTQQALIPNLPAPFNNLNALLVSLIFLGLTYRFYWAGIYGVLMGLLLDCYSSLPFGTMLVCLMITLFCVFKVFEHLLTNKSLYTFVSLTIIATFVNAAVFSLYISVVYFFETKDFEKIKHFLLVGSSNMLWQLLLNVVLIIGIFSIFHYSTKRFSAVFIDTTKS